MTSASIQPATYDSGKTTLTAWIVVLSATLFLLYEFLQIDLFNAISPLLLDSLSINMAQLDIISMCYFISNILFLFIAGLWIDRYSVKKIILLSLGLYILATLLFSITHNFYLACFFHLLTGIGSAFCFLCAIKLASRWFAPAKMAFVTSIIVSIPFLGSLILQAPLTLLTQNMPWREIMLLSSAPGLIIFILIVCLVQNHPPDYEKTTQSLSYLQSIRKALLQTQIWLASLYTCLMNIPVGILGGLWGVLYLMDARSFSTTQASWVTTMTFVGMIIGLPLLGWLSDKIGSRKKIMIMSATITLILMGAIVFVHNISYHTMLIYFTLIGFATSAQVISYPLVAASNPQEMTATAISIVSISSKTGILLLQLFFGILLNKRTSIHLQYITHHYLAVDFQWAILLFPFGILFALLASILIKESYCKPKTN